MRIKEGKMIKNAGIIIFMGLMILIVSVSGCITNNNTSNQSSQDVEIQIITNSPWNGTLTYSNKDYNITGERGKKYNLGRNPGHVAIYIKKNKDTENLTVQLIQGRNIIQTQTIYSSQEVINLTYNF